MCHGGACPAHSGVQYPMPSYQQNCSMDSRLSAGRMRHEMALAHGTPQRQVCGRMCDGFFRGRREDQLRGIRPASRYGAYASRHQEAKSHYKSCQYASGSR